MGLPWSVAVGVDGLAVERRHGAEELLCDLLFPALGVLLLITLRRARPCSRFTAQVAAIEIRSSSD